MNNATTTPALYLSTLTQAIKQHNATNKLVVNDVQLINNSLSDLTCRDYLLGLAGEYPLNDLIAFTLDCIQLLERENCAALYTVLASYYYEKKEKAAAQDSLSQALKINGAYPLAILLLRVFAAGWPSEAFATMRGELHPQVVAKLSERLSEPVLA